jgi:hypothetical protein
MPVQAQSKIVHERGPGERAVRSAVQIAAFHSSIQTPCMATQLGSKRYLLGREAHPQADAPVPVVVEGALPTAIDNM